MGLMCAVSMIAGWVLRGGMNEVILKRMLVKEYQRGVGDGAWTVARECVDPEPNLFIVKGGRGKS